MQRSWYLVADIGGTNARFAVGDPGAQTLVLTESLAVADHAGFSAALATFLEIVRRSGHWSARPAAACLAVAGPVHERVVAMTNAPWTIDRDDCAACLGLERVEVLNDFAAIGYAVPALVAGDWRAIGSPVGPSVGRPDDNGDAASGQPIVVLGPGTGLGVCSVLPTEPLRVLAGEGGHVDLPVATAEEIALLLALQGRFGRVSAERALSGPGLVNIYASLLAGQSRSALHDPLEITRAAVAGSDPLAERALHLFCALLGAVAGNAALTLGARGGVYLAGGILPAILDFLAASAFRERFVAKGRYRGYLEAIPTRVIVRENPGLLGALRYLAATT